MQYMGGKSRLGKRIASQIKDMLEPGQSFVDLFCGSCNVVMHIDGKRTRVANDINLPLISMWRAVQDGWIPPENVPEQLYHIARRIPDTDPLKAFIGFGCSFGGRYFEGYARNSRGDNYARAAKNAIIKK